LTDAADVLAGLQRFRDGAHSVVSVARRHPAAWHHSMDRVTGAVRSARVDDAEWVLTGAFYIVAADRLRDERRFVVDARTVGQEVPPERSIDVDEPSDLVAAEGFAARRPVASVRLADRELGVGRPFVIAEAGVNHNGDPASAHRLVDAAADAGADAVKFQTFEPGRLVAVTAPTAAYQRSAGEGAEQRSMLERLALAPDVWPELKAHATQRAIVFLSTPFDDASAALLDRLDVAAFKVGSGELTNVPFLETIARYGRPMLVSTGMAEMVEVSAAVDAVRGTGNADLVLLHCVSAYPARVEDANLRAMATMRAAFGTPTGWSDHTPGVELGLAAAALGAAVIEKHLTLDRSMRGPDHAASLEPREFRILVDGIAATVAGLGSGLKVAADAEQEIASVARRSLHWSRALDLGEVVRAEDLVALRPATGISPANREAVVGRRVAHRVEAGAAVVDADLEQPA
jgi:N-acetylneuraminate synthase/N,N'-diacetyllegionaminate synthase